MQLTLSTLRCPDTVVPETRVVNGGEYTIGRGPDNDWVLPDPHRLLSKRHCLVAFRAGSWQISDSSSNGTFVNHEAAPIGDRTRPLQSGDRLGLGAYEIEVQITHAGAEAGPQWRDDHDFASPGGDFASPGGDFASPGRAFDATAPERFQGATAFPPSDARRHRGHDDIGIPDDFNPFADDPPPHAFRRPAQSDHSPAIEDAFRPPVAIVPIPDDWALDPPVASTVAPPLAASLPASAPAPRPQASGHDLPQASGHDLMAAFLRGAGIDIARPDDPERAMQSLGEVMRAMVTGLRQTLIARLSVKSEFRIEQTMVRASGNNPLKFSADDDDALAALLGAGRRKAMPPAAAVTEALRDIRLHELATMTAMQDAVHALLARFDPATLERQAAQGGFSKLLSQGKARAWDAFTALHSEVSQALADDFDSVFGKAFARAYERALRDMAGRENPS